jgi:hypothetical protein
MDGVRQLQNSHVKKRREVCVLVRTQKREYLSHDNRPKPSERLRAPDTAPWRIGEEVMAEAANPWVVATPFVMEGK